MRVNLYGMDGIGRTKTEAKENAGAAIRAALAGDYASWSCLTHDGQWGVVVWREPFGWAHRLLTPGAHGGYGGSYDPGNTTREEAIRWGVRHLAQCAGLAAVDALCAVSGGPLPGSYLTHDDREDILRAESWALAYQAGRAQGMDDPQARQHADAGRA